MNRYFSLMLFLLFFLFQCTSKYPENIIQSKADIEKYSGKEVTVIGRYKMANLNQKPSTDTRTKSEYYKIEVNDSLSFILLPPYMEGAKRSKEEVTLFNGKIVKVIGKVNDKTYMDRPSINEEVLILYTPCFTDIKRIELID